MSATRLLENSPSVRFDLLHKIKKESRSLPKLIEKTRRIAKRRDLPMPTFLTVIPFVVHLQGQGRTWIFGAAHELGRASERLSYPTADRNRPAGPCMFMNAMGDVLVDQYTEQGHALKLLRDADETRIIHTFSAHDLELILAKICDFRMELLNYNLMNGFYKYWRKFLDFIS